MSVTGLHALIYTPAVEDLNAVGLPDSDIVGSSMGSPRDFEAMLDHVTHHGWAPVVDSEFALDDIAAAYARLDDPARVGKVVIVTEGGSR